MRVHPGALTLLKVGVFFSITNVVGAANESKASALQELVNELVDLEYDVEEQLKEMQHEEEVPAATQIELGESEVTLESDSEPYYVLAESIVCPSGYTRVTDNEECSKITSIGGKAISYEKDICDGLNRPRGCSVYTYGNDIIGLRFNTCNYDSAESDKHASVCKQSVISPTTMRPTSEPTPAPTLEATYHQSSNWFSDDTNGGISQLAGGPVDRIECEGRYCDDKRLGFTVLPVHNFDFSSGTSTGWFSEEDGQMHCPEGKFVMQLHCNNKYCDNLNLKCFSFSSKYSDYTLKVGQYWTDWFSEEEQGIGKCDSGYLVTGIDCRGKYCDELRLHCQKWGVR